MSLEVQHFGGSRVGKCGNVWGSGSVEGYLKKSLRYCACIGPAVIAHRSVQHLAKPSARCHAERGLMCVDHKVVIPRPSNPLVYRPQIK
eukprot:625564-Amphidinium_carterae.1